MGPMYYIGLDVHKQKISYCVKDSSGKIYAEGWIPATRFDLDRWMTNLIRICRSWHQSKGITEWRRKQMNHFLLLYLPFVRVLSPLTTISITLL